MTQGEALSILKTGANVFLTGEPGSGKTHTINAFTDWLKGSGVEPSITAATGIAATHVAGMTLHSWSGIQVYESLSPAEVEFIAGKEHIARRLMKAKVLVIEEISMLSATTLELADLVCREARRDQRPFGGLTVIFVGDFFQLPPVSRGSKAPFAYESKTWRELNPLVCYLTEQHRQDDSEFMGVLSAIRSGEVEELHYEALLARKPGADAETSGLPKLFSHNADVDRLNAEELAKLPAKSKKFLMQTKGKDSLVEGLKRGCLSPETLELKEGAAVMFTKNSPQGRFVNGTLGVVRDFGMDGLPIIETREGELISAEPMEWQVEEQGKVKASISQVPLRLAYAMTVHKSQGMSMDGAVIDLTKAFEYGQGYVALSRVRRLSGVHLLGMNQRALEVHPEILERDRHFRAASEVAGETFAAMPQEEVTDLQKKFVKAMGGAWMEKIPKVARKGAREKGLPGRLAETLSAVRDGKTLKEVAKARALAASTIVKHLEELAELGSLIRADFSHLVAADVAGEIAEALAESQDERLAPVFHALGGRHSFETIRLARLAREMT